METTTDKKKVPSGSCVGFEVAEAQVTHNHGINTYIAFGLNWDMAKQAVQIQIAENYISQWWDEVQEQAGDMPDNFVEQVETYFEQHPTETYEIDGSTFEQPMGLSIQLKPQHAPPAGYRSLQIGEEIHKDDVFLIDDRVGAPIALGYIGCVWDGLMFRGMARKHD